MTTENDDLQDRIALLGPGQETEGMLNVNQADVTGQFPTLQYWFGSSVNQAAYGSQVNNLTLGGGFSNINFSLPEAIPSNNTKNRIIQTGTGHSFEMDDTAGNERILIRHNSGNGIELRPDGSIVIAANDQTVSVTGDQRIVIEGNATIIYNGNVDMEVAGDYNLNVKGDYNVNVGENKAENVEGSSRTTIEGNTGQTVKGSKSTTVLKTSTATILGDNNIITKGVARFTAEGNMQISSGDIMHVSGKNKLYQSSDNMNIAATDMSIFSSTGVIGGPDVITHVKNMYATSATFTAGVTSPTFTGDLTGMADTAIASDTAVHATYGGGVGSPAGWSNTNTATDATTRTAPSATNVSDYLTKTTVGAVDVKVDIDNHFLKLINKSDATGGLSTKDLSVAEVRSKTRDDANLSNDTFVGNAVASGVLDPSYTNTTPNKIGRVSGKGTNALRGSTPIANGGYGAGLNKFQAPQDNTSTVFTPELIVSGSVTAKTLLARSVPLATFTTGKLNEVLEADRLQIARNLQPQAELLRRSRNRSDVQFANHRMVVVEGLYTKGPSETITPLSINWYKSKGRAVVYELHDELGAIDIEKTFDLAEMLKNISVFEKIILDFDTFDPAGSINAQLIIIMPNLNDQYVVDDGSFFRNVETRFNGKAISNSDLIEVLA
tara:strand:+ start:2317 stop:4308 length:1992 start_codon:yes stop_codon:yes gene_type:complete